MSLPESLTPGFVTVLPHGDLFHENAPDEWIERVFEKMEADRRHVYLATTKRPRRMQDWIERRYSAAKPVPRHIALAVSAERQVEANERISALLRLPAVTKWLMFFSLFEAIDLYQVPDATPEGYRKMVQVALGAGGWAVSSASSGWYDPIRSEFLRLGVPVIDTDLQEQVAERGF